MSEDWADLVLQLVSELGDAPDELLLHAMHQIGNSVALLAAGPLLLTSDIGPSPPWARWVLILALPALFPCLSPMQSLYCDWLDALDSRARQREKRVRFAR